MRPSEYRALIEIIADIAIAQSTTERSSQNWAEDILGRLDNLRQDSLGDERPIKKGPPHAPATAEAEKR